MGERERARERERERERKREEICGRRYAMLSNDDTFWETHGQ
jgi:hypothetical protein